VRSYSDSILSLINILVESALRQLAVLSVPSSIFLLYIFLISPSLRIAATTPSRARSRSSKSYSSRSGGRPAFPSSQCVWVLYINDNESLMILLVYDYNIQAARVSLRLSQVLAHALLFERWGSSRISLVAMCLCLSPPNAVALHPGPSVDCALAARLLVSLIMKLLEFSFTAKRGRFRLHALPCGFRKYWGTPMASRVAHLYIGSH